MEQVDPIDPANPTINSGNTVNDVPQYRPFKITMELPLFLSIMCIALSGTAVSNILLYRTCMHALGHPKEECIGFLAIDKTNETQKLEKEVQQYVTFVSTVKSMIEAIAPAILSCFLAVWSDTHGRKPLVVWPLFGLSITSMLVVVYAMFDNLGPWWYILTVIPYSLCGGFTVLFTGAFCYLSDITTKESRSLRMTILEGSTSVGSVLGAIASSYILRAVGNVYLLLIVATLQVVAYVYTNVWIQESIRGAVRGGLSSVIDLSLVKEMMRECFKKRANNGRPTILLLTLANSLSIFILYGLMSLQYLYTREKLHWTIKDATLYSAAYTAIGFFGSFLGVIVVQKLFRIGDIAMANVAFFSGVIDYTIKALAASTWHMYLSAILSMFSGLSSPLIRSSLTKILPVEDIAKVFALMSAIEGIAPLISPVMYNSLYGATLYTFPSSIYVLSIGITMISIVATGIVQYFRWNVPLSYQALSNT